jgi:hypothetical protein
MAIGINWGEIWAPVWKAVWTQSPPIPPTPEEVTQTPAGRSKRKRRYEVEIDGQIFPVESPEHARALLEQAKELALKQAPQKAEAVVAQRIKAKAPEGKPIRVPVPQIYTPDPELISLVSRARIDINKMYRDAALAAEIALRLKMQEIDDDDDEILMLL